MELIKWKWRLCSCHEWPKFELDFSQTSVNSIDCTWICVNASKSKWQNRIIITLLWHLCMPGEGHSQTRDYRAGHTLPAKWSQGNNLAASEAFLVGFIRQYFPVQLQVDRGIQKSTKQLPPTSSTHRCRVWYSSSRRRQLQDVTKRHSIHVSGLETFEECVLRCKE